MAMIQQVRGQDFKVTVRHPRLSRMASYLAVVVVGLLIGAFVGLIASLYFGLINFTC